MSTHQGVEQDERTEAVLGLSGRLATFYFILAIPCDFVYRAIVRHEIAWDLMALLFGGVAICLIYQARQKILGKTWWMLVASIAAVTFITGVVVSSITQNAAWNMAVTGVVTGITAGVVSAAMFRQAGRTQKKGA